nr:MAG TPA_asm: hypothetical protein [Caudoviricetes sp.]
MLSPPAFGLSGNIPDFRSHLDGRKVAVGSDFEFAVFRSVRFRDKLHERLFFVSRDCGSGGFRSRNRNRLVDSIRAVFLVASEEVDFDGLTCCHGCACNRKEHDFQCSLRASHVKCSRFDSPGVAECFIAEGRVMVEKRTFFDVFESSNVVHFYLTFLLRQAARVEVRIPASVPARML